MNRLVSDILNQQEQEDQGIFQSEALVRDMICQDFIGGESRLPACDVNVADIFQRSSLLSSGPEREIPVRTSNAFSVHKHTLCQIPYFHTHDFYELIYVLRGSCTQEFGHFSPPLVLREKQACLLRPGVIHSMSRCGSSDVILKFTVPPAIFARTANAVTGNELNADIQVFQAEAQADFLVYMLMKENYYRNDFWVAAIEHYLSLLFIALVREPEYHSSALSAQLAEYLDAHPQSVTLDGFASSIGYSRHHTARLLKQHTGQSFLDGVVSLKMKRAREMLSESDIPIAEIAKNLGYSNASGLHKQFSMTYGMTPSEYRRLFNP